MQTKLFPAFFLAAGLLLAAPALARHGNQVSTLHVAVTEEDATSPKITLSFPVDFLEALAGSFQTEQLKPSTILGNLQEQGFDLRSFWKAVRELDIKEFFTLQADETHVRAWREDGLFHMTVDAQEGLPLGVAHMGSATQVEISLPEALMDYLVEEEESLQPEAVFEALRQVGPMTLVDVKTDESAVRVWTD
ncbi:MAG: hypothetical protein ACE5HD_03920 [Acidobacteriota bacterium]